MCKLVDIHVYRRRSQKTVRNLSGLALAKYILKRLTEDDDTVEELTQDFDDNEDFVLNIIAFLKEIGWLKEEQRGKYIITDEGAAEW